MSLRAVDQYAPKIIDLAIGGALLESIVLANNPIFSNQVGQIDKLDMIEGGKSEEAPILIRAEKYGIVGVAESFYGTLEGATDGAYAQTLRRLDVGYAATGDLNGIVRVGAVVGNQPYIKCSGDFIGTIAILGPFDTTGNPSTSPFIQTGADGLRGQILVNASGQTSYGFNSWTAPVKVGPDGTGQIVLDAPGYSERSSDFGGGDVGLLPMVLHLTDCSPQNAATRYDTESDVIVSYQGPVTYTGSSPPFSVAHRPSGSSGSYSHDLTSCFTYSRPGDPRDVALSKGFWPVGDYQVSAAAGVLKNNVFGVATEDVFDSESITFTIAWPCLGDLNADNAINTADLTLLLAQFGQSDACGMSRDLNGDLAVNTADLTLLLANFGNSCNAVTAPPHGGHHVNPTAQLAGVAAPAGGMAQVGFAQDEGAAPGSGAPGSGIPGTPGAPSQAVGATPPVIAALGYTSAAEYEAYLNTLNQQQLDAEIARLLAVIAGLGY